MESKAEAPPRMSSTEGGKKKGKKGKASRGVREQANWQIHLLYVQGKYDACLKLVEAQLTIHSGLCEYPVYVKGAVAGPLLGGCVVRGIGTVACWAAQWAVGSGRCCAISSTACPVSGVGGLLLGLESAL